MRPERISKVGMEGGSSSFPSSSRPHSDSGGGGGTGGIGGVGWGGSGSREVFEGPSGME